MTENITYLYCRKSTPKQNIERQIRNLKALYPDGVVIPETYSGTTTARPRWSELYKKVKSGDVIAFDSVSRMSRNAAEGADLYQELFERGVTLVFLKEPHINTEVYKAKINARISQIPATGNKAHDKFTKSIIAACNELAIDLAREQVMLAFEQSEKEVLDLRQRTKEGIRTAHLAGRVGGQKRGAKVITAKSKHTKKEILRLSKDFNGTLTDAELIKLTGVARNTYYKYKAELKAETAAALEAEEKRILAAAESQDTGRE